jgi:hypothetical protein
MDRKREGQDTGAMIEESDKIAKKIIEMTFNSDRDKLPTKKYLLKYIIPDDSHLSISKRLYPEFGNTIQTHIVRCHYIEYNYSILTHEFMLAIKRMVKALKLGNVSELCSGPGWFSHWLRKYGVTVEHTVDNKSWNYRFKDKWLPVVKKQSAITYVKQNPDIDLFILSWPYMDNTAERIWKAMRQGQFLLYIGESWNANDIFHEMIHGKDIPDNWKLFDSHISFWGIHDRPVLFQK